jgi:membrane peptidoglycan carboxypeptidase
VGTGSVGAGTGSVGGRASVARAAVRPGSAYAEPNGRMPGGPGGGQPGKSAAKILSKVAKRRRRANIFTAAAAVVVILLGAGVVGGAYFFDNVDLPPAKSENQSNTILYGNKAVMLKAGEQNLTVVPEPKINKIVEHAVAAAEDKNFYHHNGIDMKGIARAAWNNFTGGDTQGASTITQQYARHAAELKAISYNRKLREAVIARKLETKYNKDQIMGLYLNYIYLGEGRYGIEAAAQGYFGKSVTTPEGQPNAITPYEAAVLASIIKQPEASATYRGYDPNVSLENSKSRWEYTMANMLEMNWISQDVYNKRVYPTNIKAKGTSECKTCATNKPVDMIKRHVMAELKGLGLANAWERGGLTVQTTINPKVQAAAEAAGSTKSKDSPLYNRHCDLPICKTKQKDGSPPLTGYQSTVIGVDPNTGEVLGYYGGDDPNGTDYGDYLGLDGEPSGDQYGVSPGSSFKIYTLAAALKADISFKTTWDGTLRRKGGGKINNADSPENVVCKGQINNCDLETATIKSYNFPFYWIADKVTPAKVLEAARAAGINRIIPDKGKAVQLSGTSASAWSGFDDEVGFGQYRVLPLEHAEGVATVVNGGVHHAAHFIKQVLQVNPETGVQAIIHNANNKGNRVFDEAQMSNLNGVLAKVVKADSLDLKGGRESVAKSGTWEYQQGSGDCWFVGGIPQLAATVWVGSNLGAAGKFELKEKNGKDMFGARTPGQIWKKFLDASAEALALPEKKFPDRQITGDDNSPLQNGKKPAQQPQCFLNVIGPGCDGNTGADPNNGGNAGNNNGGNNNGGNNNGNGNTGGNGNGNTGGNTFPGLPGLPANNDGNQGQNLTQNGGG